MTETVPTKAGELRVLSLSEVFIKPDWNHRFDATPSPELIEQVRSLGVVRPISVRKDNGAFSIIDGERRYRAAKTVGLKTIPAIDRGVMSDEEAFIEAVVSNMNQQTLSDEEKFNVYARLEKMGMKKAQIAEKLGVGFNRIREYHKINKRGTPKLKGAMGAPKDKRVEARTASQIASLPHDVQDEVVEAVRGKSQRDSLNIVSKKRTELLGGSPKARQKLLFRRPKDDIPPPTYRLAEDATDRCRQVETETHRRIRVKGRNAEFKAYLDLIEVMKGKKEPMSLFG